VYNRDMLFVRYVVFLILYVELLVIVEKVYPLMVEYCI
jgi:hypothetical protein